MVLKIYDILGQEIAVLVDEEQKPGFYEINFNAAGLPSGIYIYRIQAGQDNTTMKMSLLK